MSTPYFDVDNPAHLELLPRGLRDAEDLVAWAKEAERRAIDAFTYSTYERRWRSYGTDTGTAYDPSRDPLAVRVGPYDYVALRGYTVDAALCLDPLFVQAMRAEIAALVRWIQSQWTKEAAATYRQSSGDATNYRADVESALPPGFGRSLRRYDLRPRTFVI